MSPQSIVVERLGNEGTSWPMLWLQWLSRIYKPADELRVLPQLRTSVSESRRRWTTSCRYGRRSNLHAASRDAFWLKPVGPLHADQPAVAIGLRFRGTARAAELDRRTADRSVGAINTAIAAPRLQHCMTVLAIVVVPTRIHRHPICRLVTACRAGQRGKAFKYPGRRVHCPGAPAAEAGKPAFADAAPISSGEVFPGSNTTVATLVSRSM